MKPQKETIKPSQSTGPIAETLPSSLPEQSTSTLHRSCESLSIYGFKKCYCCNDLSHLVITGTATPDELSAIWNEILFEYSGLIRSDQSDHLLTLSKDIALLQHHIFFVENAVELLKLKFDQEVVDGLVERGYYGEYNFEDKENYHAQLDRCVALCTTNVFELSVLRDEYKRIENTTQGKKQTEEELNESVVAMGKYQGYRINQKEVSIMEFTSMFNLYLKDITNQKKQSDGRR